MGRSSDAPAPDLAQTIVDSLAASLGEVKARELVAQALERSGVDPKTLTRREALEVLERIAKKPGLVGITARFVKSRLLLGR